MRRFESYLNKKDKEDDRGMLPSAVNTDSVGTSDAISKAASKKEIGSKIALAKQGASLLGVGGEGDSSVEGGAASGALSGAAMGAKFGPYGALVGGAVGGIAGAMGASAQQKAAYNKAKHRAEATHYSNLASIEQEKDRKIQSALQSMRSAFSRNLNNNKTVKL